MPSPRFEKSGNPNGRPLKGQALTEILQFFAEDRINFFPGHKRTEKKIILAAMIWDALVKGHVQFPDRVLDLDINQWIDVVKWVYTRLDGPPPQRLNLEHGGNIHILLDWGDDNGNGDTPEVTSEPE